CAGRGPRIDELVVFATSIKGRMATEYGPADQGRADHQPPAEPRLTCLLAAAMGCRGFVTIPLPTGASVPVMASSRAAEAQLRGMRSVAVVVAVAWFAQRADQ